MDTCLKRRESHFNMEGLISKIRLKSVVNRFPAHRVHHSEGIIAAVAFSLCSLSKDRSAQTNLTFYRDDVAVAMTTQIIEHSNYIPKNNFLRLVGQTLCTLYYTVSLRTFGSGYETTHHSPSLLSF